MAPTETEDSDLTPFISEQILLTRTSLNRTPIPHVHLPHLPDLLIYKSKRTLETLTLRLSPFEPSLFRLIQIRKP
jgi:hypothetical protein